MYGESDCEGQILDEDWCIFRRRRRPRAEVLADAELQRRELRHHGRIMLGRTPLPDDGDTGRPTAESDSLVAIVDIEIDPASPYLRAGIPDDIEPVVSFGQAGHFDPRPHRQHGKIRSNGIARRSLATGRAPSSAVGGRDERRPGGVARSARTYSARAGFGENKHQHD